MKPGHRRRSVTNSKERASSKGKEGSRGSKGKDGAKKDGEYKMDYTVLLLVVNLTQSSNMNM